MLIDIMENSLLQYLGVDPAYIFIGIVAILLVLFIIIIVQQCRISKLNKRLAAFMSGKDANSLEEEFAIRFQEINKLREGLVNHAGAIEKMEKDFREAYSKIGIVKYDAFNEMGGKLSFALCLLNERNDGFLMNSMHNREGCYMYIKEIVDGKSYIELSDEEEEALTTAVNTRNYMVK